jgi:hypothetical protein
MVKLKKSGWDLFVIVIIGLAVWFGLIPLSTIGILIILFVIYYWFFEKGPDKGFIRKSRR